MNKIGFVCETNGIEFRHAQMDYTAWHNENALRQGLPPKPSFAGQADDKQDHSQCYETRSEKCEHQCEHYGVVVVFGPERKKGAIWDAFFIIDFMNNPMKG
ncbi:hypothetical protein EON80_13230 [bacterium]|nr:MAG: hypothetical protein EON80_13230 [bacterium]